MRLTAASGMLDRPGTFLHHGWVGITVPNLILTLIMLGIFALAVLLPFPHDDDEDQ